MRMPYVILYSLCTLLLGPLVGGATVLPGDNVAFTCTGSQTEYPSWMGPGSGDVYNEAGDQAFNPALGEAMLSRLSWDVDDNRTLIIRDVTTNDEGEYSCTYSVGGRRMRTVHDLYVGACRSDEVCADFYEDGSTQGKLDGITTISVTTSQSSTPCSRQGLFKVTFNKMLRSPESPVCHRGLYGTRQMLKIDLYLSESSRSGWMFNIGDSYNNNGYGGESGVSDYCQEIQGLGDRLSSFGSTFEECAAQNNWNANLDGNVTNHVTFYIANNYFLYVTDSGRKEEQCSKCLFALDGRIDVRAGAVPADTDVYIALNRVVLYNARSGHGLCSMKMAWMDTVCAFNRININGNNITFPTTNAGETAYAWERCSDGGAIASRLCAGDLLDGVRWGPITYNAQCRVFPELNQSESTLQLRNLSKIDMNVENAESIINSTTDLTRPTINLTEADVISIADIIYNYWQLDWTLPHIMDGVYEIVNNVLQINPDIIDAAQMVSNAGNRILKSVEEITSNVNLDGDTTLRIVKSYLATAVFDQDGENITIGLKLKTEDASLILNDADLLNVIDPADADDNATDTAIYLDEEILVGKKTRTVFQLYSVTSLFTDINSDRFVIISKVVAARLEIDCERVSDLGNNTVTAVFKPVTEDEHTVCAFWDYGVNEAAGGWDTEGCTKTVTSDGRIECRCNHLTNFAILIDLEAYKVTGLNKVILKMITKVGLIASIIGLGLIILTFLMFKHLRTGRGQRILTNLAVAMLGSSVIFLVGIDRTENVVLCKVIAALLHYFILVSFMWMLVEGVQQYLRFVKVLGTYIPNFMAKAMVPAWGIPILPVGVVAVINHDMYYSGNGYCWLSRDAMLYAFIIPIAVILFANLLVFCLVMCSLLRRAARGMRSNQSETKMACLHFQAAVSVFVVLGLTWTFGFLAIDGTRDVFHYIFSVLNAFQGFFIFLLFTVRERKVRGAWRRLCCNPTPGKATSSNSKMDGLRSNPTSLDSL